MLFLSIIYLKVNEHYLDVNIHITYYLLYFYIYAIDKFVILFNQFDIFSSLTLFN